jgi:hypothetical protein
MTFKKFIDIYILIVIAMISLLSPTISSAGGNPEESETAIKEDKSNIGGDTLEVCPEPRPELCTMNYLPVCAQRKDGAFKSYANGCTSCTDTEVIGYRDGECETTQ